MPKSGHRTQPKAADRPGRKSGALAELAKLRGTLSEPRRRHEASARKEKPPAASPDDDLSAFSKSLGDVTPLKESTQRAEISPPKPRPVRRPRPAESPEQVIGERKPRLDTLDGAPLFRAAMSGVVRIQADNLADIGRADPNRHRHSRADFADQRAAAHLTLRLPANADEADPADLFRYAIQGTQAIEPDDRAEDVGPPPLPHPIKRSEDEQAALRESMEAPLSFEDRLEMGDEAVFLRPGLPRRVLIDLRRGRWVLQGQVDLHGFNRDAARAILAQFLVTSLQQGRRCVRVIHGKGLGSPGKESILKQLSRGWLAQREEILAFCQAGPHEGGSGALLVLLRAQNAPRP